MDSGVVETEEVAEAGAEAGAEAFVHECKGVEVFITALLVE